MTDHNKAVVAAGLRELEPGEKVRVELDTDDAITTFVNSTSPGKVHLDPEDDDDLHEDLVADYTATPSLYGIIWDPHAEERLDSRFGTITGLVTGSP